MNDNITICKRCGKGFNHNGRKRIYCSQSCYMEILKLPVIKKDKQYIDTAIKIMIILLGILMTIVLVVLMTGFYNRSSVEEQLDKKFEIYLESYFRD